MSGNGVSVVLVLLSMALDGIFRGLIPSVARWCLLSVHLIGQLTALKVTKLRYTSITAIPCCHIFVDHIPPKSRLHKAFVRLQALDFVMLTATGVYTVHTGSGAGPHSFTGRLTEAAWFFCVVDLFPAPGCMGYSVYNLWVPKPSTFEHSSFAAALFIYGICVIEPVAMFIAVAYFAVKLSSLYHKASWSPVLNAKLGIEEEERARNNPLTTRAKATGAYFLRISILVAYYLLS